MPCVMRFEARNVNAVGGYRDVIMELWEGKTFEFASLGAVSLKGFDEAVTLFRCGRE